MADFIQILQFALKDLDCSYDEFRYPIELMSNSLTEINNDPPAMMTLN